MPGPASQPMKHTTSSPASSLASQFAAWRKRQSAAKLGAVALISLSNLRSAERDDGADAARQIAQTVATRSTDDNTQDEEQIGAVSRFAAADETAPAHGAGIGAYLLTPSERAALTAARPGALSVIFRLSPVVVEVSDPLPAGFTPATVADFAPAADVVFSAEELAEIDRDSAAEIAEIDAAEAAAARIAYATAFVSDWQPRFAPVDSSPDAGRKPATLTPILRTPRAVSAPVVAATPTPIAATVDVSQMDFAALRAAVLARRK